MWYKMILLDLDQYKLVQLIYQTKTQYGWYRMPQQTLLQTIKAKVGILAQFNNQTPIYCNKNQVYALSMEALGKI